MNSDKDNNNMLTKAELYEYGNNTKLLNFSNNPYNIYQY